MTKLIVVAALLFAAPSHAAFTGRFDLSPTVSPLVMREMHDGQWLAGVAKENLWHLDYQAEGSTWNGQRLHVGVFQAWNAEHGNASFGPLLGLDLPVNTTAALGQIGESLGLPATVKPLQYLSAAVSLDGFVGYRPVHSADVNGTFVYGFAARLKVAFGMQELQKGN